MRGVARVLSASLALASSATATASTSFSAQVDALWDFSQPQASHVRFVEAAARHPSGSAEQLEIATQIARTHSLQRDFAKADATLDAVGARARHGAAARARALPARTRSHPQFRRRSGRRRSVVHRGADRERARCAARRRLLSRRRAAHAGHRRTAANQLDWNLQALALAETASGERARGWRASLHNNVGWIYFAQRDYEVALVHWRKALAAREAAAKPGPIRIAKWTVARGLRADGQLDAAQELQLALAAETEAANAPDGYVYEELAEIAAARGDANAAAAWAAKAHALLSQDAGFVRREPARLARLATLAGGATQ